MRSKLIRWLSISVGLLIIIVIVVSLASGGKKGDTNADVTPTPQSFTVSAPYGKDTIAFSNGRSFVSYNYQTGKAKTLSPDDSSDDLGSVDSIAATKNRRYILFHLQSNDLGSAFYTQLNAEGLDTSVDYWWMLDTTTQTYHHFDRGIAKIHLGDDSVYTLTRSNNRSAITTYSLPDYKQKSVLGVIDCTDFYPAHGEFALITSGNTVFRTRDGIVNTPVFDSASIFNVANDSAKGIGIAKSSMVDLAVFDLETGASQTIATNVNNNIVVSANNNTLFSTGNGSKEVFHVYDSATGNVTALNVDTKSIAEGGAKAVAAIGGRTALIKGNNGVLYLVGNGIASLKNISNTYSRSIDVNGRTVEVDYFPLQTAFIITLDSTDVAAQKQAVYNQLQTDGINPSLVDIRFTVFTYHTTGAS